MPPMVLTNKEFLSCSWQVGPTHVLREGNRVAYFMANLAHSKDLGLHRVEGHPQGCREFLFQNFTGASFSRFLDS